jgi:hypothetical protein
MSATLTIDATGFRRAILGLSQFTPLGVRAVIRAEAGSILKACAGDTKVATQDQVDLRTRVRTIRDLDLTGGKRNREATISVNAGLRGPFGRVFMRKRDGTGWRRTHEAGFKPLHQHYRRGDWIDLQEAIATVRSALRRAIPAARGAIGLARQSWVQIADDFGTPLERVPGGKLSAAGIAKARAAIASTGQQYRNGQAREYSDNRTFVLTLINRLPFGRKIQLDSILARHVNGRARYFEQNLARGVFDNMAHTLRAYPGLRIQRN